MSRVFLTTTRIARTTFSQLPNRSFALSGRAFSGTPSVAKGSENSTPGWEGRPGSDHVLHRDDMDVQASSSIDARKAKDQGGDGSDAISQKDERNANQKAKEEHPEAPGPVIGMNSERGSKE